MRFATLLNILFIAILGTACSNTDSSSKELEQFVQKANDELFNKGNLDFADEAFAADYGGQGPAAIKSFLGEMRTVFPRYTGDH